MTIPAVLRRAGACILSLVLATLAFGNNVSDHLSSGLALCFLSDANSGSEDTAPVHTVTYIPHHLQVVMPLIIPVVCRGSRH